MNLKDLFNLAGESGKLVFIDDSGEVKGVFLTVEEYLSLKSSKTSEQPTKPSIDPETVNQQILHAQLQEVTVEQASEHLDTIPQAKVSEPKPLSDLLANRAEDLFMAKPFGRGQEPSYDLRQEVINPDFGKPEEVVEDQDNQEEIKPRFDDI